MSKLQILTIMLLFPVCILSLIPYCQALSTFCQVFVDPSELLYAYHKDSVNRAETASANCRNYPRGLYSGSTSEHYIHCDGTQLKLVDSDLGEEQYNGGDYYVWYAATGPRQLLFIFPTRVNFTTITLHYYSDSQRGLPRLRFYAAPDDFDIWDTPPGNSRYVHIAAVPPGAESAGRRSVNINVNFNTRKILMVKITSTYQLAVSEVEFFTFETCSCNCEEDNFQATNSIQTTLGKTTSKAVVTTRSTSTERTTLSTTMSRDGITSLVSPNGNAVTVRESIAWTLAVVVTVLFLFSLTINITLLCVYKKRQTSVKTPACEMEGNPCYEATKVSQSGTADTSLQDVHVYDTIQGRRGN